MKKNLVIKFYKYINFQITKVILMIRKLKYFKSVASLIG